MTDAQRFNASSDVLADIASLFKNQSQSVFIWPQNASAVYAFLAITSQWRVSIFATKEGNKPVFIGLDYSGAEAGLRLAGIRLEPGDWAGVRIMEAEARKCLNGD